MIVVFYGLLFSQYCLDVSPQWLFSQYCLDVSPQCCTFSRLSVSIDVWLILFLIGCTFSALHMLDNDLLYCTLSSRESSAELFLYCIVFFSHYCSDVSPQCTLSSRESSAVLFFIVLYFSQYCLDVSPQCCTFWI